MNNRDDNGDDRLIEDYRRASDAAAGRPGDSTRNAILEGARAAARSRQPAANDSRYAWSAAAGIAVLGIALLLWRQADPDLVATAPASPAAAERNQSQEQPVVAQANEMDSAKAAPGAVGVRAPAAEARSEAAADASMDEGARKLRDRFPDAWASPSPPAMVWLVEDERGNLLRQGTLASGEPLPAPQSASAGWTLQTAVNGAGIPVRIATAREQLLAPAAAAAPAEVDR
jgi:hypothetical protein